MLLSLRSLLWGHATPPVVVTPTVGGGRKRPRIIYRESEKPPWEREGKKRPEPIRVPQVFHVALSATMAPAIASLQVHTPTYAGMNAVMGSFAPSASIEVMQTNPWTDEAEEELLIATLLMNGDM